MEKTEPNKKTKLLEAIALIDAVLADKKKSKGNVRFLKKQRTLCNIELVLLDLTS